MKTIAISKEMAHKCAEALVKDYNNGYESRAVSCNKIWFRDLYENLQRLGLAFLIASAKGSQEIRDYGFYGFKSNK